MPRFPFHVLAVAVLVAGCVQPGGEDTAGAAAGVPDLPIDPFALFGDAHDHGNPSHHEAAWNATLVAYDPVGEKGEPLMLGELDHRAGLLAVATSRPGAGFVLYDVTDPAAPQRRGSWTLPGGYGADVKLSPDGRLAFLAVEPNLRRPDEPIREADVLAAATDHVGGIHVLDVSDPDAPRHLAYNPLPPIGPHMITVHEWDGAVHVFAAHNSVGTTILRLEAGGVLRQVGQYRIGTMESPHDVGVQETPDGRLLLSIPHGYRQLQLVDATDVTAPEPLGTWTPEGPDSFYVHTAQSLWRDGRQYTVVVPEVWGAGQADLVAPVWVVDSTDPEALEEVGRWANPGGHGADGMRFSTHNFQLVGDTAYLAHYHGGVWRLDLADPTAPRETGFFLPSGERGFAPTGYMDGLYTVTDVPAVWDVVVVGGYAYVSDMQSGLYVVAFDGDPHGDPGHSSTA